MLRRALSSSSSGTTRHLLYHTPLKSKLLQCNSPREITALLQAHTPAAAAAASKTRPTSVQHQKHLQESQIPNAQTCVTAAKRLGEIKNQQHQRKPSTSTNIDEQDRALRVIYKTCEELDDDDFPPREVSRLLHKVALFKLDHECLPRFALDRLHRVEDYAVFTPVELSNLAWALAKYKHRDEVWFQRTCDTLVTRGDLVHSSDFLADHTSNLLWSFAILKFQPSRELLDKFAGVEEEQEESKPEEEEVNLKAFKLQALVNTVWAFAKFGYASSDGNKSTRLTALFDEAKTRNLTKLRPQSLANLLWAQAKLGHEDAELMRHIEDAVVKCKAKDLASPVALENLVVGLAAGAAGGAAVDGELKALLSEALLQLVDNHDQYEDADAFKSALAKLGLSVVVAPVE